MSDDSNVFLFKRAPLLAGVHYERAQDDEDDLQAHFGSFWTLSSGKCRGYTAPLDIESARAGVRASARAGTLGGVCPASWLSTVSPAAVSV